MGAGQQARLVLGPALRQRTLEVQGPEHSVLGGADGQLDETYRPRLGLRVRGERAVGGEGGGLAGVAGEPIPGHHINGGQDGGERAHDRGLRGALLPAYQHPADVG